MLEDFEDFNLDESDLNDIFQTGDQQEHLPPVESTFLADVAQQETDRLNKKYKKPPGKLLEKHQNEETTQKDSDIHKGDTDSSDDEDNKYFHLQKYNECGKNLKQLLQEKEKPTTSLSGQSTSNQTYDWKAFRALSAGEASEPKQKVKTAVFADPVFHMRIIKPQIAFDVIKERMVGRTPVLLNKIKNFIVTEDTKNKDWVTGGAVVGRSIKTSQKGNQYCILNLSDLHNDIKIISVFLFGSAYKEFWKTELGVVIGILNPNILEQKDNTKNEATLSVDNAQRIMIFGTSKDYGTCKSKRKNGEDCCNVVNTAKCEYCVFHLKQEYSKISSSRMDLQSSCAGRGLNDLRNKVLGKNEVFYGGKSFIATKNYKQKEKDNKLINKLGVVKGKVPDKDKAVLEKLDSSLASSKVVPLKNQNILDKINAVSLPDVNKTPNSKLETPKELNKSSTPFIQTKLNTSPSGFIDLDIPFSKKKINLDVPFAKKKLNLAKLKAVNYVKQNGVSLKENKQKTPERIEAIKRKIETETDQQTKKIKIDEKPKDGKTLLKEKLERNGIDEEFLKLMKTEVQNKKLLRIAEDEVQEKYYKKLEIREQIEEKMLSTYKVECKAVRCLKCNYKSFSASDLCKKENHPLKVVNAVKRFWKCGDCGYRTVCLELVPLQSCKTCGGSKWEKAAMMKEKKDNNLIRPHLSIRGNEETFIGSSGKGDINLLVPE